MTITEFGCIMAYIGAGCGKELSPASIQVYFDLLGDLPARAMEAAAKKILLELKYPVFPSIAELRKHATDVQREEVPIPAVAWHLAQVAVASWGIGHQREALERLPAPVAMALRALPYSALCDCENDGLNTLRAHFFRIYESICLKDERLGLMPPAVKELIGSLANGAFEMPEDREAVHQILGPIPARRKPILRIPRMREPGQEG